MEYSVIQKRLDTMYLDRLDGRITTAFYDRMAAECQEEQARLAEAIGQHRQANRSYLAEGARLLELASTAAEQLRQQEDAAEKRELLRFILASAS